MRGGRPQTREDAMSLHRAWMFAVTVPIVTGLPGCGNTQYSMLSEKENAVLAEVKDLGGNVMVQCDGQVWVSLGGPQVTDATLANLAALSSLQGLDLYNTQVTDAGLKQLTGLSSLRELRLANMRMTNDGLKHVSRLNGLKTLSLSRI